MLSGSAGKRILKEEGDEPLIPSSTGVVVVCVMKLTCAIVSSSSRVGVRLCVLL